MEHLPARVYPTGLQVLGTHQRAKGTTATLRGKSQRRGGDEWWPRGWVTGGAVVRCLRGAVLLFRVMEMFSK